MIALLIAFFALWTLSLGIEIGILIQQTRKGHKR